MKIGTISVDGKPVGIVSLCYGENTDFDPFIPDLDGYSPEGRATEAPLGMASSGHQSRQHRIQHGGNAMPPGATMPPPEQMGPEGPAHAPRQRLVRGTSDVNEAIEEAAKAHHLSPAFMKAVASIESGMNPLSNADNPDTQYKGLYQIGQDEWRRFGDGGNPYSANDNAMAAARMFEANRAAFHEKFGRDPTDSEMYLMHQQGLGFYTNGTMTNIAGNLPAGARTPENMTHEGFERYWGNQVADREAQFSQSSKQSDDANPPPASILAKAKQVAQSAGTGALQQFMAANGYPKDGNWCGEFAAAVVKSTGGAPPKGAAVASNWRNWGQPTSTPKPGDIAIRRGPPTGSTGSHVTFVDSYDPSTGTFQGIGGNQGAWEESLPASRYEFRTDRP